MEITVLQLENMQKNDKGRIRWVLPLRGPLIWLFSKVGGTDDNKTKTNQNPKFSR
jgi:hypothetical protein